MNLGAGKSEVGGDVPAGEWGGFPVQSDAPQGDCRSIGGEPRNFEWTVVKGRDAVDESTGCPARHRPQGDVGKRADRSETGGKMYSAASCIHDQAQVRVSRTGGGRYAKPG